MDYRTAKYFAVTFFTSAQPAELQKYVFGACEIIGGNFLKLEAVAIGEGLDISKYRRRKYSAELVSDYLGRAIEEGTYELGVYITSVDYTKIHPPSFLLNWHLSLRENCNGNDTRKMPSSFLVVGVRKDVEELASLELFCEINRPSIIRGGHWVSRLYDEHGASLEWAYKNYRNCELETWNPSFDKLYT